MTDNPWKCAGCGSVSVETERTCDCPTGCLYRHDGERTVSAWKTDQSGPPPSAKDYAAAVVEAKFTRLASTLRGPLYRRALTRDELSALLQTAYDAGVLAQQRFAERKS